MEWVVYILHFTCNDVYFLGVYIFVARKTIDRGVPRRTFVRKNVHIVFSKKEQTKQKNKTQKRKKKEKREGEREGKGSI